MLNRSNNRMADLVVKLLSGSVRGVVEKHEDGFNYYAFRGIPYAEPPTGELRFKDPVPKKAWAGVIDCKNYGPICLQHDPYLNVMSTDEDCLYLNVYTRTINDENAKKPVIVCVHGGAYMFCSGAGFSDDLAYVFKMQLFEKIGLEYYKKGSKCYRIMEQMTEMWANFATYGRPTIETSELIPVHWKPISNGTLIRYLSIDEDITMKSCVNVEQMLLSAKDIVA